MQSTLVIEVFGIYAVAVSVRHLEFEIQLTTEQEYCVKLKHITFVLNIAFLLQFNSHSTGIIGGGKSL